MNNKTTSGFIREKATVTLTMHELGVLQSALSYAGSYYKREHPEMGYHSTMQRVWERLDAIHRAKVDEYFEYNK